MLGTSAKFIELGMSLQPFQEDREACQHWVTHSWMKSMWEKDHHLCVEIDIAGLPVHPPWERDSCLMKEFVRMNYNSNDCRRPLIWYSVPVISNLCCLHLVRFAVNAEERGK
jgi:hypothetical protein